MTRLAKDLLLVPGLAGLGPAAQKELVEELAHGMAFFPLMQPAMKAVTSKTLGNRPHLEAQVLILDCARALKKVTGKPAPIWCSPAANSESRAVKVARVCLGVLRKTRRPFQGNLKRQAEQALKMSRDFT
jgi:hypothetical protein